MFKHFLFKSGLDIVVGGLYEFINSRIKAVWLSHILKIVVQMLHGFAGIFLDNNSKDDEQAKEFVITHVGGLPAQVSDALIRLMPNDLTEEDAARFRQVSADYDYFIQRILRTRNNA